MIIEIVLTLDWHQIDICLAEYWHRIGLVLIQDCHKIDRGMAQVLDIMGTILMPR